MTPAELAWLQCFLTPWGEKHAKSVKMFSSPRFATKLLYDLE